MPKLRGKGKEEETKSSHYIFAKMKKKKNNPSKNYTILSAGTDGRDGPTNAAGAILDQNSIDFIKTKNIDLNKELEDNNSYEVLKKLIRL